MEWGIKGFRIPFFSDPGQRKSSFAFIIVRNCLPATLLCEKSSFWTAILKEHIFPLLQGSEWSFSFAVAGHVESNPRIKNQSIKRLDLYSCQVWQQVRYFNQNKYSLNPFWANNAFPWHAVSRNTIIWKNTSNLKHFSILCISEFKLLTASEFNFFYYAL